MSKRILIIRPDKIGDLILTLPMATALKNSDPDTQVLFLVQEYTAPLARLCSDIDEVIIYNRNSSLRETIAQLRDAKPDAIFVLGHKLKLTLASFLAGIPVRAGRAYFWFSFLYNKKIFEHRKTAERNEAEFNIRMLCAMEINDSNTPLPKLDKSKLPVNPIPVSDYIVFHIPTGGSAPSWSEEHYTNLSSWISQNFSSAIVLTGLPSDNSRLLGIAERMKHNSHNVHINTESNLLELASLLASARLVISGSTGPGHIASALGTPTIGLFPGVTALSKERWGFRGEKIINLSTLNYPQKDCPECRNCNCIDEITELQVQEAITLLKI